MDSFLTELYSRMNGKIFKQRVVDNRTYDNLWCDSGPVLQEKVGLSYDKINSYFSEQGQIGDILGSSLLMNVVLQS